MKLCFGYCSEAWDFLRLTIRYNASSKSWEDKTKADYLILRQAHTLEKGMSLRSPREGFGKEKALRLEADLKKYEELFGPAPDYPRSVLADYYADHSKGTVELRAEDVNAAAAGNFESLLRSRHSVRYFTNQEVDDALLVKALELAALSPSACNRQAWKTHIYKGADVQRLLQWQGGSRGFESEPTVAVLVSSDLRGFLSYEVHQAWVDGGMYAMNLVNALHSLGLGTIPLSTGFDFKKLRNLRQEFDIPESEVPVLIIGAGHLEDAFRVARSERKDISQTNTWH